MKAILQRVTFAEVKVDGNTVGKIDNGKRGRRTFVKDCNFAGIYRWKR